MRGRGQDDTYPLAHAIGSMMALWEEKQVEREKKIKNSDLTLLTLRHPSRDVKKALRSTELCSSH